MKMWSEFSHLMLKQSRFGLEGKQRSEMFVVYQARNGDIEVITTFWIDKDGLRKYGFARI